MFYFLRKQCKSINKKIRNYPALSLPLPPKKETFLKSPPAGDLGGEPGSYIETPSICADKKILSPTNACFKIVLTMKQSAMGRTQDYHAGFPQSPELFLPVIRI